MDFSEKVFESQYEPQDAHFSQKQFLLRYTVTHHPDFNSYIYHLSDNRKHNHNFTNAVVSSLIEHYPDVQIYRLQSNNCSEQYKCFNVFPLFLQLAMEHNKMFIYHYGVKGHGKWLVDTMTGFGLKTPLRKAIVTEDIFYDSAKKLYKYISEIMKDDNTKIYKYLDILSEKPREQIPIHGIRKCHIISHFPSEEVKIKEGLCSCTNCCNDSFICCDDKSTGSKG